ncbi:MAG: nitrate transporter substrate-binding protein [Chloroflexi bacterium]|nr:nitrate transporter substrate-binding protein [Chloroflexota bacterium]
MTQTIRSEITSVVHSLPWFIAQDGGLFAEQGLQVEFVQAPQRGTWKSSSSVRTITGRDLVPDHRTVDSIGVHLIFEEGACEIYRACEWGQVRRSQDSARGGRIIGKRPAVSTQAIVVRPDAPMNIPQDLRNKTVGVNFHAGSHYLALMFLEGFMDRGEINVVHAGRPLERFEALMSGQVDAVGLMEPWIALAEKIGCKSLGEVHYAGAEIASADMDVDTYERLQKALTGAVRLFNSNKRKYLPYLIDEVPPELGNLTAEDFHLPRLRYVDPSPYSEAEFRKTYEWMLSWGLIDQDMTYEDLVDNRISLVG